MRFPTSSGYDLFLLFSNKISPPIRPAMETADSPRKPLPSSLHGVDVAGPDCGAQAFLSPTHVVLGFHLACLQPQGDSGDVSVTLFLHGQSKENDTLLLATSDNANKDDGDFHVREAFFVQTLVIASIASFLHPPSRLQYATCVDNFSVLIFSK